MVWSRQENVQDQNSGHVCVIIPYFRGASDIQVCIESLLAGSPPIDWIIIVDNCPDRSLPPEILANPIIQVINAVPGIGFARACNLGLLAALEAGFSYVVLLNQDTRVWPDCIDRLIKALHAEPNTMAAAPISTCYENDEISEFFSHLYLAPRAQLISDLLNQRTKAMYEVPFDGVNASCLALTTSHLRLVGLFDPVFSMYAEDKDLLRRASFQGLKVMLVPHARSAHRHSNALLTSSGDAEHSRVLFFSHQIFLMKDPSYSPLVRLGRLFIWTTRELLLCLVRCQFARTIGMLGCCARALSLVPTLSVHRSSASLANAVMDAARLDLLPTVLPRSQNKLIQTHLK